MQNGVLDAENGNLKQEENTQILILTVSLTLLLTLALTLTAT